MANGNHENAHGNIIHLIDNPIVGHADPVKIRTAGKLNATGRASILSEGVDGGAQPTVKRGVAQVREKLLSSPAEINGIGHPVSLLPAPKGEVVPVRPMPRVRLRDPHLFPTPRAPTDLRSAIPPVGREPQKGAVIGQPIRRVASCSSEDSVMSAQISQRGTPPQIRCPASAAMHLGEMNRGSHGLLG